MKNLALPALLLTFIASSNTSYGSTILEETSAMQQQPTVSSPVILRFIANDYEKKYRK